MKIITLAPDPETQCPVTYCLSVIGGKWKPVIIFCIMNGVDRFGALQRAVPKITKQMLTKQLRELEADGLVTRTVYPEVPPRVDYALTDRGRSVLPVIEAMKAWGAANVSVRDNTGRS
ncbi:winged helix-turn-helix transcriptional regulator [Roseibium sp.]|uniref:winged helix-turn-helix transcriptional regulator n=1 Tax=Roseibium sp. TaxID=1936156 RepID=UPI003BAB9CC3